MARDYTLDRDFFSLITFYFLQCYGCISCLFHILAWYLLHFRSPFYTKTYARLLKFFQTWMIVQDVFCFLWSPYSLLPLTAEFCRGLLCRWTHLSFHTLMAVGLTVICCELTTLVVCLAHRQQTLALFSSPFRLSRSTKILALVIMYSYCFLLTLTFMHGEMPRSEQEAKIKAIPQLEWLLSDQFSWVVFSPEAWLPFFTLFSIAAVGFLLLTTFHVFDSIRSLRFANVSKKLQKYQQRAVKILLLQLSSTFMLIGIPATTTVVVVFFGMFLLGRNNLPFVVEAIVAQLILVIQPIHTLSNTLIFIILSPRYVALKGTSSEWEASRKGRLLREAMEA